MRKEKTNEFTQIDTRLFEDLFEFLSFLFVEIELRGDRRRFGRFRCFHIRRFRLDRIRLSFEGVQGRFLLIFVGENLQGHRSIIDLPGVTGVVRVIVELPFLFLFLRHQTRRKSERKETTLFFSSLRFYFVEVDLSGGRAAANFSWS